MTRTDTAADGVWLRPAQESDCAAIAEIYNHYIEHTTVTFHTELTDVAERRRWLAEHDERHPVLVAEKDGIVVAWGSLSPWADRPAWRHTVEATTYVHAEHHREGLGRALMEALLDKASTAGHHAVIAQIVADNQASIALGESMGFEHIGLMHEVGRKFDRWLDVVLMERII